jgi:hypothetical protein
MAFALYALLGKDAPSMTADSLAADLKKHFAAEKDLSIDVREEPFSDTPVVALRWPGWGVSVTLEQDDEVLQDSQEIQRILGDAAPRGVSTIDRRIRAVFGNDPSRMRTNETIFMMEFLEGVPGALVFDPQQKKMLG